jgi:hypothetical protein
MNTKLTLRLNSELIESAKTYAAREGRSVSELVAAYFERLDAGTHAERASVGALSRKSRFYGLLAPAATGKPVPDEASYRDHLAQKHR